MKKFIVLLSILALSIGALSGCGNDKGEKVYVYNWGQYIDEDVLKEFKEKHK